MAGDKCEFLRLAPQFVVPDVSEARNIIATN